MLRPTVACLLLSALLPAQVDRHELGLRLRAFERHLAAVGDDDAGRARRDAALAVLDTAVQAFFRLDLPAVGRAIAGAEAALRGRPFTPAEATAQRLQLQLGARLVATGDGVVPFRVSLAWQDYDAPAPDLVLRLAVTGHPRPPVDVPLTALPFDGTLPLDGLPAGDLVLSWQVRHGDAVVLQREQGLSLAERLAPRLQALDADDAGAERTLEALTLRALVRTLQAMTRGRAEETVLPGARLLAEAEALQAAGGKPYYGPARPGEFWLRLPVGKQTVALRLSVPAVDPAAAATERRPLLLLLHGAGGSENLFFDGYGDGMVARTGAARGYYVAAPALGFGGFDAKALLDALAVRFPFDPQRVLLVGHSMGAMQAVANAGAHPDRFRAVVALGGGGALRTRDASGLPPFFVGAGSRDFARAGARQLHDLLQARSGTSEWHEYPGVEHLAVVQLASADVFAFFDRVLAQPPAARR